MEYSESYQRTRDIDWFFKSGDRNIHVASNGGKLPDFVNDVLRLRKEQAEVSMLASTIGSQAIIVNEDYVKERVQATIKIASDNQYEGYEPEKLEDAYLVSFREMASKGFYSYDRVIGKDSEYVLVCAPPRQIDLSSWIVLLEATDEIEFDGDAQAHLIVKTVYRD